MLRIWCPTCRRMSWGDAVCRSSEENGLQRAPALELVNSFPYAMPPAVPMPRPSTGCSRAQPWLSVKRVRDGTGVGEISQEAWWIPTEADATAALAAARAEPAAEVPPVRVGRKRARVTAIAPAPATKVTKPKGPPVKMELVPLPTGVPEGVPIFCNGRTAVLYVRQQKVEHQGELMPPSRFEQVCGKGDAKKWKATLFHYDAATEEPTVCMQDWLGLHKLDRATLQRLKDNYEGHAAWVHWQQEQDEPDAPNEGGSDSEGGSTAAEKQDSPEAQGMAADRAVLSSHETPGVEVGDGAYGRDSLRSHVDVLPGSTTNGSIPARHEADHGKAPAGDSIAAHTAGGAAVVVEEAVQDKDVEMRVGPEPATLASEGAAGRADLLTAVGNGVVTNGAIDCADLAATEAAPGKEPELGKHGANEAEEEGPEIVPGKWGVWKARSRVVVPLGSEPGKFSYEFRMLHVLTDVRNTLAQPRRKCDPASWVGRCVRVFWPDDGLWYSADVVAWRPQSGTHVLLYHADDEEEELDLVAEERQRRLQWLNGADSSSWPSPPHAPLPLGRPPAARMSNGGTQAVTGGRAQSIRAYSGEAHVALEQAGRGLADAELVTMKAEARERVCDGTAGPGVAGPQGRDAAPSGEAAVGWRVEVFWEEGDTWCKGMVEVFEEQLNRYKVHFDDGDLQWVDFSICPVRWLKANAQAEAAREREQAAAGAAEAAAEALARAQAEAAERARSAPAVVDVICNGRPAQLLVRETAIIMENGSRVSPTEFERLSGKGAAKKWKGSIRVRFEDGRTGPTIGEWLVQVGLEVNKGALLSSTSVQRRRFPNRRASNPTAASTRAVAFQPQAARSGGCGGGSGGTSARKRHRADCQCIICKQARRKWGVTGEARESTPLPLSAVPDAMLEDGGALQPGRPALRTGKHAFVNSTPYLPRGCASPGQAPISVPTSRCWHPQEWGIYWALQSKVAQGAADDDSGADDEGQPQVDRALLRVLQPPSPHALLPQVVRKGMLALLGVQEAADETGTQRLGIPSAKDKVLMCRWTERDRLTTNKSGIHGWGLTALCNIPQVLHCHALLCQCIRVILSHTKILVLAAFAACVIRQQRSEQLDAMSSHNCVDGLLA
eukprot:jgi/Ulvmu1/12006/UM083_0019.1